MNEARIKAFRSIQDSWIHTGGKEDNLPEFVKEIFSKITDDNILTEDEVKEWEDFKTKNEEISNETNPIFLCNDVADLEMEIALLEDELKVDISQDYDVIEHQLLEELKECDEFIKQLEEQKVEAEAAFEQEKQKYEQTVKNTFQTVVDFINSLLDINEKQERGEYLCLGPLNETKREFDSFLAAFVKHVNNHVHHEQTAGQRSSKMAMWLFDEQKAFEECLSSMMCDNFLLEFEKKSQDTVLTYASLMLEELQTRSCSLSKEEIIKQILEMEKCETFQDAVIECKDDLLSICQAKVNIKIMNHLYCLCHSKYCRIMYWLSCIEKWQHFIKNEEKSINHFLNLFHSEGCLLDNCLQSIRNLHTFFEKELNNSRFRMAHLRKNCLNHTNNEALLNAVKNMLQFYITGSNDSKNLNTGSLETGAHNLQKIVSRMKHVSITEHSNIKNVLYDNKLLFKEICNHLLKKTCNQNIVTTTSYWSTLQKFKNYLDSIEKEFNEKQVSMDDSWRHKKLLWIYFLCDQKKLQKVVSAYIDKLKTTGI